MRHGARTSACTRRSTDPRGAEVLVLGVSYKPGVGDLRESPAVEVVKALTGRGMRVTIADPHVSSWTMTPRVDLEDLQGTLDRFDLEWFPDYFRGWPKDHEPMKVVLDRYIKDNTTALLADAQWNIDEDQLATASTP